MGRLMMYTGSIPTGVCNTCDQEAGHDASGRIIEGLVPLVGRHKGPSHRGTCASYAEFEFIAIERRHRSL